MTDEPHQPRTPRLRFPEFQDAGEWEEERLKDLCVEFVDGDWIESKDQSSSGIRLIQTGNIGIGTFIYKSGSARYISHETFKRLRCTEVIPGDCLISRLPDPAGRACLIPNIGERMITAVDCTIVRFDVQKIIPYIFIVYSQSEQYSHEVRINCSGSTRQRISRENLSRLVIKLPTLPEQKKIADCFRSLDEVIIAQRAKLDALTSHKQGLMQQLFPVEGETVPRLRFPEFQDAGEWESQELGEISNRIIDRVGSEILTPVSITAGYGFVSQESKFGRNISGEQYKNYILLQYGDFAYNRGNSKKYPQGYICQLHEFDQAAASTAFLCFRLKDGYRDRFIQGLFDLNTHGKQLAKHITSSARSDGLLNINANTFFGILLPIPSLAEQQKIAECLSSLDALISAEKEKLAALLDLKQGLMQQLFPMAEEVDA